MADSKPSMLPGQAGRTSAALVSNTPTMVPPASAARAASGCGCQGAGSAAAGGAPGAGAVPSPGSSLAAPSLRPASAGAGSASATWQNNAHVSGMWSINQDRNCWAHLDTVGWRNLSGASESGLVSLNMLAAHAYQSGAVGSYYEEDDGRVSQIYVW